MKKWAWTFNENSEFKDDKIDTTKLNRSIRLTVYWGNISSLVFDMEFIIFYLSDRKWTSIN